MCLNLNSMKKFLLLLAGFAPLLAFAQSFKSIEFTDNTGKTYVVDASGLTISFDGSNICVVNSKDDLIVFNAASLSSMQFTDSSASFLEEISSNLEGSVAVYCLDGTQIGNFSSTEDAVRNLSSGIYILSDSKGETIKIYLSK